VPSDAPDDECLWPHETATEAIRQSKAAGRKLRRINELTRFVLIDSSLHDSQYRDFQRSAVELYIPLIGLYAHPRFNARGEKGFRI
jgi:hypothetical protein